MRYRTIPDVWLAIIAIDDQRYDAARELENLSRSFPHAQLVGRAGTTPITARGALYDQGLRVIVGEPELENTLPHLLPHVVAERRTLPTRLERKLLREQVIHRHGMDGLVDAELELMQTTCPTFLEMERDLIKRALRVAEGRRSNAARLLNMPRATFYRRLAAHALTNYCLPRKTE